jgi:hypothetical protein
MKNEYEIRGDVTAIFVKRRSGEVFEFLIDTEDLTGLIDNGGSWCVDLPYKSKDPARKPYAIRNAAREGGGRQFVKLHRVLTDAPDGLVVDHINGDTLDTRKSNLRVTDQFQNMQNRRKPNRNNKSGELGVSWNKEKKAWNVSVMVYGREIKARFKSKDEAIKAAREMREERCETA